MSSYNPETLNVMRCALEEAWALLSRDNRAKLLKVDMAERILRRAAAGERDPTQLRAAALVGTGFDQTTIQPHAH